MKIQHNSVRKSARFNAERDKGLQEGFHYDGSLFSVDDASVNGLLGREALLRLDPSIKRTAWPTTDNQMHTFKREEFMDFLAELLRYKDGMYLNCWKKKGRKV